MKTETEMDEGLGVDAPLPWRASPYWTIGDANGEIIATIYTSDRSESECEELERLIITAVNEHEAQKALLAKRTTELERLRVRLHKAELRISTLEGQLLRTIVEHTNEGKKRDKIIARQTMMELIQKVRDKAKSYRTQGHRWAAKPKGGQTASACFAQASALTVLATELEEQIECPLNNG